MPAKGKIILLLGGARSGKSTFAQELAKNLGNKVLFVATAEPFDEEMQTRIENHKKSRPNSWRTLEIPLNIAKELKANITEAEVVLIDCLTIWVSNLMGTGANNIQAEKCVLADINELITLTKAIDTNLIIVSNEVGMGLVPEYELGRIYRDLLGKANQLIAKHANEVYFLVAGIPSKIKG